MRVLYTLVGLVLLGCGGAMAQTSTGYGKLKWGGSFEEAKALFPDFVPPAEDPTTAKKTIVDTLPATLLQSPDGSVELIFQRRRFVSVLLRVQKESPGGEPLDVNAVAAKIQEKLGEKFGSEVQVRIWPEAVDQSSVTLRLDVTSLTVLAEVQKEAAEAESKIATLIVDDVVDSFEKPKTN